jgi:hypothetical protein
LRPNLRPDDFFFKSEILSEYLAIHLATEKFTTIADDEIRRRVFPWFTSSCRIIEFA